MAVDNDGNSNYSVVESQYRYPAPKYIKRLLKLGRGPATTYSTRDT
ncbi:MAG: hypothetical protein NC355_09805 [Blautia sp.]|nr:hypothetical protein [Blautia sp.]